MVWQTHCFCNLVTHIDIAKLALCYFQWVFTQLQLITLLRYLALFNFANGYVNTHQTQSVDILGSSSNLILKNIVELLFHKGVSLCALNNNSKILFCLFVLYYASQFDNRKQVCPNLWRFFY